MDATLIQILKPSRIEDDKLFYSGKHHTHGIKLQIVTAPDGIAIHYGGIIPGSRNDLYLYGQSGLVKAMTVQDTDLDGSPILIRPPLLADGGYLGIRTTYPEAVIPYRKSPHKGLTFEQKEANRLLSQDRVVVERFFGRLKAYWGILQKPYRSERSSLDALMRICVALTNLKIRNAPLTADEKVFDPCPSFGEEQEEGSLGEHTPSTTDTDNLSVTTQSPISQTIMTRTIKKTTEHTQQLKARTTGTRRGT